jgi:dienelactone hydrolase
MSTIIMSHQHQMNHQHQPNEDITNDVLHHASSTTTTRQDAQLHYQSILHMNRTSSQSGCQQPIASRAHHCRHGSSIKTYCTNSIPIMLLIVYTITTLLSVDAFTLSPSILKAGRTNRQPNHDTWLISNNNRFYHQHQTLFATPSASDDDFDEDEDEELESPPVISGFDLDENEFTTLSQEELTSMTVAQLKQQLRLRGRKVAGNKSDLVARLLERSFDSANEVNGDSVELPPGYSRYEKPFVASNGQKAHTDDEKKKEVKRSKRVSDAKARGADIVDVTDFVDAEEVGRSFRSSDRQGIIDAEVETEGEEDSGGESSFSSSSTEVWGEDARIVDDYEGRSIVVDGLSRTVIEYKGSNGTLVQAYVVGSRDSLKNFLRGGQQQQQQQDGKPQEDDSAKTTKTTHAYSSMEEEVYAIQKRREFESKRGLIQPDEVEGQEDSSDPGTQYNTIERDYGDWGVFTPTGAQLSSSEVQGVLLLSDVYGPFTDDTQALADKIAFECQPVVVLVPDLFRGKPWTTDPVVDEATYGDGLERNEEGKTYEEWRAMHPERRVDVDIRAAAAVLRERYAVSSIAVWGTCYGGGRALEAAAGWYDGGASSYYDDAFSDRPAPPHVDPIACVAWYPTRYDAKKLFGKDNEGFRTFEDGKDRSVAVMAVFAEDDELPGATPDDALLLKSCLDEDSRVKDAMVKIFPDQKHGFAHANLGAGRETTARDEKDRFMGEDFGSMSQLDYGGGDAEVACLLSTAWMETYSRVFLPTVGSPVSYDEEWSTINMKGYSTNEQREIRRELEEAIAKYEDVEIDMRRLSQSRSPFVDDVPKEFDEIEEEREKLRQKLLEQYNLSPDDDDEVFEQKLKRANEDGALNGLLLDAYFDDSNDAYW